MKDQRWKTMVVEGRRRGEDGVRNGGVWMVIYRECGSKRLEGHKCSQKTW